MFIITKALNFTKRLILSKKFIIIALVLVLVSLILSICIRGEIPLPLPKTVKIKNNSYTGILAEVDSWKVIANAILKEGKYGFVYKNNKFSINVKKDTQVSLVLSTSVKINKKDKNSITIQPQCNECEISFDKPLTFQSKGKKLIDLYSINKNGDDNDLDVDIKINIANLISYGVFDYIFDDEVIKNKNIKFPSIKFSKLNIKYAMGKFSKGSVLNLPNGIIKTNEDSIITFTDVNVDKDKVSAVFASDFVKLNSSNFQINHNNLNFDALGLKLFANIEYNKEGVRFNFKNIKNNLNSSLNAKRLIISNNNNKLSITNPSIDFSTFTALLPKTSKDSRFNVSGNLSLKISEMKRTSKEISYELKSSEINGLQFDMSGTFANAEFKINNPNTISIFINNLILPTANGTQIESASIEVKPFTFNKLSNFSLASDKLIVKSKVIVIGTNSPKKIKLIPQTPLEIDFIQPLEFNLFKTSERNYTDFKINGLISDFKINSAGNSLSISNVKISSQTSPKGIKGTLSLSATISKINNEKFSNLSNNCTIGINNLEFSYDGNLFSIIKLPIKLTVPYKLVTELIRKNIPANFKRKEFNIKGRDLGRILSLGIIKDNRGKSQIYGARMKHIEFRGDKARVIVSGAIRLTLEVKALTTEMVKKKIRVKKIVWRKKKLGVKYPEVVNTEIIVKVPRTYYKWKDGASATVKAGLTTDINYGLPKTPFSLENLTLNPTAKIINTDIKGVPGWIDKRVIRPFVFMLYLTKGLKPVSLLKKEIKPNTKGLLKKVKVNKIGLKNDNDSFMLDLELSGTF